MPIRPSPLPVPEDDARIWRYTNLTKFLSLLMKKAMYFTAMQKLVEVDPLEGSYTAANLTLDGFTFESFPTALRARMGIKGPVDVDVRRLLRDDARGVRDMTYVNCWHVGEHESAAMWKIYSEDDTGIAIQSRVGKLKAALDGYPDYPVFVASITYLDYSREMIPEREGLLYPCFFKRKSFEYEGELRAAICTIGGNLRDPSKPNTTWVGEEGLYAEVNPATLVENVFVAPNAPAWFVQLLDLLISRLGFDFNLVQSDLTAGPLY